MANSVTIRTTAPGAKQAASDLGSLKTTLGAMGVNAKTSMALAGAAVGSFAVSSVQDFATFQHKMNEVFTLMPGISKDAMGKMTDDVMNLSNETGKLPEEIIPALYQAISAGVPRENVFDFLRTANQTAVAGVTDTESAVDLLTGTMNAYRIPTEQAATVSDAFFTAVRLGKTTIPELSASMSDVTPIAASMGVSLQDSLAAITEITKQGTPTAAAITQVKAALVAVQKGKFDQVFKDMGYESGEAAVQALGFQGAMEAVRDYSDRTGISMTKLTGRVEGANAVLQLTGANAQDAQDILGQFGDTTDATAQAFETMDSDIHTQADKIVANVKTMMLKVGGFLSDTGLGPIMTAFGPTFGKLIGGAVGGAAGYVVKPLAKGMVGALKAIIPKILPQAVATGAATGVAEGEATASAATSTGVVNKFLAKFGLMTGAKVAASTVAGTAEGVAEGEAAAAAATGPGILAKFKGGGGALGAALGVGFGVAAGFAINDWANNQASHIHELVDKALGDDPFAAKKAQEAIGPYSGLLDITGQVLEFFPVLGEGTRSVGEDMRFLAGHVDEATTSAQGFDHGWSEASASVNESLGSINWDKVPKAWMEASTELDVQMRGSTREMAG